MDIKNLFQQKSFRIILVCIGISLLVLVIFRAGMFFGFQKAEFSSRWAENYHRNFDGPRQGGIIENIEQRLGGGNRNFIGAHGTSGTILKIDTPTAVSGQASSTDQETQKTTLIIKDQNNTENIVVISDDTVIRAGTETIKTMDLKIDDHIVIIGTPDEQGEIQAKFIRIFR